MIERQIEPLPGECILDFIDCMIAYADATLAPHRGTFNGGEVRVTPGGSRIDRREAAYHAWGASRAAAIRALDEWTAKS